MERRDRVEDAAREIGRAIRHRRREVRLTQQDLADLSGVGVVFVISAERGKSTLRLDRLLLVVATLGLRLRIEDGAGLVVVDDAVA